MGLPRRDMGGVQERKRKPGLLMILKELVLVLGFCFFITSSYLWQVSRGLSDEVRPLQDWAKYPNATTTEAKPSLHRSTPITKETIHETIEQKSQNHPSHQLQQQQQQEGVAYWRYDDVGPTIYHARTHYLSSIPSTHRIGLYPDYGDTKEVDDEVFLKKLYEEYATNPDHVWPKKLHLFEYNPSIAKLPEYYHENELWRRVFRDPAGNNNTMPLYVSVYRVGHRNNCYDGPTNERLFGGSWKPIEDGDIKRTDYIGVSLMDADLNVVLDTTVTLAPIASNKRKGTKLFKTYNDYRLFNLGEKLYLTTMQKIVPIELELVDASNPSNKDPNTIPKNYVEIPFAFQNEPNVMTEEQVSVGRKQNPKRGIALKVWVRKVSSCPLGSNQIHGKLPKKNKRKSGAKNFLYFNKDPKNDTAKVLFYPRFNPNDVRDVYLSADCDENTRHGDSSSPGNVQPIDSFETIEKLKYPDEYDKLFVADRGSACCVSVKKNQIRPILETSSTLNDGKDDSSNDDLLVAMVHPKTLFPGKNLPPGVIKNTYLSRFIAFLPEPPYTIVARSGIFCLGYPSPDLDGQGNPSNHDGPLTFVKFGKMKFANETYRCPRIHFVMGMVDKVKQADSEPDSVILSYGVRDCLSRFVEIRKSEIVRMLSADAYNKPGAAAKTG